MKDYPYMPGWRQNKENNKPTINHSILMLTTHGVAEGEWDGNEWTQYRWSCKVKDSDVLYWIHLEDLTQLEKEDEIIEKEQQPAEQLGGTFTSYDMAKTFTDGQNYVIAHPEKFGLCKPAEWKPQSESLEALMYAIEGKWEMIKPTSYLSRRLEDLYEGVVNTFNVDESLVAHENDFTSKPAEWSEEDEYVINKVLNWAEIVNPTSTIFEKLPKEQFIERLKSLRPQPHWKPSKEQMDHLAYAYTQLKLQKCYAPHVYESLGSLYDDLKKLI